jgi:VCBS repeat-containing protein
MSKSHHGHSHHSHHHDHDRFWDHHHAGQGFVFGSRGDDLLTGTDDNDVILGRHGNDHIIGADGNDWLDGDKGKDLLEGGSGNDKLFGDKGSDELYGGDGNDWLFGGKGNDLLDGGAGSDKVFGGNGNDVAVYVVADHVAAEVSAADDFYDGGKGHDVLRLVLTSEEMKDPGIKSDIEAFQAFLADHANGCGSHGDVFEFQNLDLVARNFEALEVVTGNAPPVGVEDAYTVDEDHELEVQANPVNKGILANDTDADNDPLTAILVDGPQHGKLEFSDDGSFKYTPEADYFGSDAFTYKAFDGTDESEVTKVAIEVNPVNDAPIVPTEWTVNANQTNTLKIAPGPDNESDQVLSIFLGQATHGTVGVDANDPNTIVYTPADDYVGHDSFGYAIIDDNGEPQWFASSDMDVNIV